MGNKKELTEAEKVAEQLIQSLLNESNGRYECAYEFVNGVENHMIQACRERFPLCPGTHAQFQDIWIGIDLQKLCEWCVEKGWSCEIVAKRLIFTCTK